MKKRILFLIPSFAGGGAEKVLLTLLKDLDLTTFEPTVVCLSSRNDYPGKLRDGVKVIFLEKKSRLDFFRITYRLSLIIRQQNPDLLCGFLYYSNIMLILSSALSLTKTPIILTEHNHLAITINHSKFRGVKKLLVRILYPLSSKIICVSKGIMVNMIAEYGVKPGKCTVIYNPFSVKDIFLSSLEEISHPDFGHYPVVISCGRLTTQKNYPLLFRAMRLVNEQAPVKLAILGDGELRSELESLAVSLGIGDNVVFLGFKSNPFSFIGKSFVFVLSSIWEGFGNVIVEAMACGTPVISTNCPSGPDEIITHEIDGLLVPVNDEIALANSILRVLQDTDFSDKIRCNAFQRSKDFDTSIIIKQYERIFLESMQ